MANRRPRSVTPSLQFMLICRRVETDEDGAISFREIFENASAMPAPVGAAVELKFVVVTQFRDGTGEHKFWLKFVAPNGDERTSNEMSFWLPSRAASHRFDNRIQTALQVPTAGQFRFTAVLDGRDILTLPLNIDLPAVPESS